MANVLGDSDNLNAISGVQYVLIKKKKKMNELIFLYSAFSIPTKFHRIENLSLNSKSHITIHTKYNLPSTPMSADLDTGNSVSLMAS